MIKYYPDGEEIPAGLPAAYAVSSSNKKCSNCKFYSGTGRCTLFNAPVRGNYVCALWESKSARRSNTSQNVGGY